MALDTDNDEVVGMVCASSEQDSILIVSENGYGKRTLVEDYRITNRGGKGVKTLNVTEKTGDVIAIKYITDEEDLMITTKRGIMIRMAAADLRVMGRATQGVRLINLKSGESIASVAKVPATEVLIDLGIEDAIVPELGSELGPELGPEAGSDAVE
jgi:DNA gyrase subunit A